VVPRETPLSIARLSASAPSSHDPSLAAFTVNIAESNFRHTQGYNLLQTFEEVETGKGADALDRRPQLSAALKAAKQHKAPIIVAKLDRLSRDVHFISGLMAPERRLCGRARR
jgi:Resolvase, N terminal domain